MFAGLVRRDSGMAVSGLAVVAGRGRNTWWAAHGRSHPDKSESAFFNSAFSSRCPNWPRMLSITTFVL